MLLLLLWYKVMCIRVVTFEIVSCARFSKISEKCVLTFFFYPQQLSPNVSSAHLNSIIIYIRRRMLEED
jgi:hypothetical protein